MASARCEGWRRPSALLSASAAGGREGRWLGTEHSLLLSGKWLGAQHRPTHCGCTRGGSTSTRGVAARTIVLPSNSSAAAPGVASPAHLGVPHLGIHPEHLGGTWGCAQHNWGVPHMGVHPAHTWGCTHSRSAPPPCHPSSSLPSCIRLLLWLHSCQHCILCNSHHRLPCPCAGDTYYVQGCILYNSIIVYPVFAGLQLLVS